MNRSTARILIGLGLGIGVGLFLGDRAAIFKVVADIYLRLLQMTVLPYVIVSVIAGFGALDAAKARGLFLRVGALTLALWGLTLGLVLVMPLTFPTIETASFFSTSLVQERPPLDFISLYVPTNAFQSLANSVVPAVVLFSGFLGVALIGIKDKEPLLSSLRVLAKVLARANQLAVKLTPIGLFAIAANAVGTTDTAQLGRLRVFLVAYGAMALLLALWILPGLVACLTPVPVRRILAATKDVLITAFFTGDLFVVLAVLLERSKELLKEHGFQNTEEGAPADVIIPAFFNFPHAAKLLSLSFVLFAAWYSDTTLSTTTRAQVSLAGVVSLFGSMNTAMPFLLDLARVPADTFELFLATGIFNARFGTLTAAMHMIVLAIAGTYAFTGKLQFSAVRILRYAVITVALTAATLAGVRILLRATGQATYNQDEVALTMEFRRPPSQKAVVLSELPSEPLPLPRVGASVLDGIRERGRLRVCYFADAMPYSFANSKGELVGFDVEMAYILAQELEVALEFAPVTRDQVSEVLEAGRCDVVMAGTLLTTLRASRVSMSQPYLEETLAFIVPDNRRADFSSADWIRETRGLRVAVPDLPYLVLLVEREFPKVTIVKIPPGNESVTNYFKGRGERVDALVLPAERGSFLTLLYPAFSVAVPQPVILKLPLAYPVARRDVYFAQFMSRWIDLKKKDGTIQDLYNHWILGHDAQKPKPHWSVLRNVLHWVD